MMLIIWNLFSFTSYPLIHVGSMMVLATSETPTTGMLASLSNTTVAKYKLATLERGSQAEVYNIPSGYMASVSDILLANVIGAEVLVGLQDTDFLVFVRRVGMAKGLETVAHNWRLVCKFIICVESHDGGPRTLGGRSSG